MPHHKPNHDLFLLRHAKSDWDKAVSDFDRPLNARGRRDAAAVGQWLHTQAFHTDAIYSSPAQRATQTALALCAGTGIPSDSIIWDERLYLAPLETLLEVISGFPTGLQSALLIGHNPGLEELLLYLAHDADRYEQRGKLLTTASFAHLQFTGKWKDLERHSARLAGFTRPRDLPEDLAG